MSNNITYTIKIVKLNVIPSFTVDTTVLNNVVSSVVFNYTGTNSNNEKCTITIEAPLTLPTSSENYVDFQKLSEEEVVSWINSTVNFTKYNNDISDYLNKNHVVCITTLPWNIIN